MSKRKRPVDAGPHGPEGVPVDAPGNEAPALSPHAVSRMHRAEDDGEAIERSPDFSDDRPVANETRVTPSESKSSPPETGRADHPNRTLEAIPERREHNPGHWPREADAGAGSAPRGRGEGELMEQPASEDEARQDGVDDPASNR